MHCLGDIDPVSQSLPETDGGPSSSTDPTSTSTMTSSEVHVSRPTVRERTRRDLRAPPSLHGSWSRFSLTVGDLTVGRVYRVGRYSGYVPWRGREPHVPVTTGVIPRTDWKGYRLKSFVSPDGHHQEQRSCSLRDTPKKTRVTGPASTSTLPDVPRHRRSTGSSKSTQGLHVASNSR